MKSAGLSIPVMVNPPKVMFHTSSGVVIAAGVYERFSSIFHAFLKCLGCGYKAYNRKRILSLKRDFLICL